MKKNFQKGMTLIELMVTIAIILILSAVVFMNYKPGQKQLALQRATNKLAQDIRRAENMVGTDWISCVETSDYVYGYGIIFRISENKYSIVADCNGDNDLNMTDDKIIEEIILENNIENNNSDSVLIVFNPPDPIVSSSSSFPVVFSIKIKDSSPVQSKNVQVNQIGAIDIP